MSQVLNLHRLALAQSRPNLQLAKVVNTGLLMKKLAGRAPAAEFLYKSGVPFAVIVRVLGEPERRRKQHVEPSIA